MSEVCTKLWGWVSFRIGDSIKMIFLDVPSLCCASAGQQAILPQALCRSLLSHSVSLIELRQTPESCSFSWTKTLLFYIQYCIDIPMYKSYTFIIFHIGHLHTDPSWCVSIKLVLAESEGVLLISQMWYCSSNWYNTAFPPWETLKLN